MRSIIQWKGYPHHFPHIRIAGKRRVSRSRSISSSRIAGRRTKQMQTERQRFELFGWRSPMANDSASASLNWSPTPEHISSAIVAHSNDGAASSKQDPNIYSVKHLATVTTHWPANSPEDQIPVQNMRDISRSRTTRTYDPRIAPTRNAPPPHSESIKIKNGLKCRASVRSLVRSLLSEPSSRTPSQKKILRRFTRELELHLQATKSLPNQRLIPSNTTTVTSAPTIATNPDFVPYKAQFAAAGLAVTSKEQRAKTAPFQSPTTPSKDVKWENLKNANLDGGKIAAASEASSYTLSSDHTVLAFTPPHEHVNQKEIKKLQTQTQQRLSIMSHGTSHVDPLQTSPARLASRKPLPWLPRPVPVVSQRSEDTLTGAMKQSSPTSLSVNFVPSFPSTSLCRYLNSESTVKPETQPGPGPGNRPELIFVPYPERVSEPLISQPRSEARSEERPSVNDPTKRAPPNPEAIWLESINSHSTRKSERFMREKAASSLPPIPGSEEKFSDRMIRQGLKVAAAAARDADVDEWIQKVTGYGVREFLGALSAFEGLRKEENVKSRAG